LARLASRQAALPEPISISEADFAALEKELGRAFGTAVRAEFEAACNAFREDKALQDATVRFSDVDEALTGLRDDLKAAQERLVSLLGSDEPAAREAVDLLEARISLRRSSDPEVEPLQDFSRHLRAMAALSDEATTALQDHYSGLSGRDPNKALDGLILRLIPIAKAIRIRVTAHYSDAKGERGGPFVKLVYEAFRIVLGKRIHGAGPAERAARVLAAVRNSGSNPP
jgi:hypothetical protein